MLSSASQEIDTTGSCHWCSKPRHHVEDWNTAGLKQYFCLNHPELHRRDRGPNGTSVVASWTADGGGDQIQTPRSHKRVHKTKMKKQTIDAYSCEWILFGHEYPVRVDQKRLDLIVSSVWLAAASWLLNSQMITSSMSCWRLILATNKATSSYWEQGPRIYPLPYMTSGLPSSAPS